jgi:hypothetical protein
VKYFPFLCAVWSGSLADSDGRGLRITNMHHGLRERFLNEVDLWVAADY